MAYPYRAYDDDDDEDEDQENVDPAVAAAQRAAYEAETLEKAIQESLKSFTQEQGNPVQAREEADQGPQNTRDHEVPHRPFTAQEIAQDDSRRESELYGPPSPPRRPRTVASLNPNVEIFTPRFSNALDANDIVRIIKSKAKEIVKETANDFEKVPTAKGASWLIKAKKYSLNDRILTVKMVMLLGTIHCPPVYRAATYETATSIAGLEDIVADAAAADATAAAATEPVSNCSECSNVAVAGSSRGSESPDYLVDMVGTGGAGRLDHSEGLDATGVSIEQPTSEIACQPINDNESALFGTAARPEDSPSPVDAVVALDMPGDANESSHPGQSFDNILAHRYETRVADIEALLHIENAAIHAALQAAHDRRITRGAPATAPMQAASNQHVPSGPSVRAAGDSAEELEWFLDETPGNARPGSQQAQSARQESQPEHGKFGFDGRGKPID